MARPEPRRAQPGLPDELTVSDAGADAAADDAAVAAVAASGDAGAVAAAAASARDAVADAVRRLAAAGIPREVRVAAVRGAFGRTRLRPAGEVWRLGALCVDDAGGVWATGDVLVVSKPTHPNHRSELALARNELRTTLIRGGVPVGATAVLDARALDLGAPEPPLVPLVGGLGVQWTPGGAALPIVAYLRERVDLLLAPPGV